MAEPVVVDDEYRREIEKARRELRALIFKERCAPLMLQLAFSDAATYNASTGTGGPNGSIRNELSYPVNKGLERAVDLCGQIIRNVRKVSYADVYQLAGVVAVEVTGGPTIDFVPGRKDSDKTSEDGLIPYPETTKIVISKFCGVAQLRHTFNRMGLDDRDIVALSGAHTLGKAHTENNDFGLQGPWTKDPLKFNNSYFQEILNMEKNLLRLPSDQALVDDPKLRGYVELYARDEDTFFKDYAASHKKLSELGLKLEKPSISNKLQSYEKLNPPRTIIGIVIASAVVIMGYLWKRKPR